MRKILLLSAAALLATAGAASAATVLSLDGFCNAYKIKKTGGGYALQDTGCSSAYGGGLLTSIKGTGKNVVIALHDPGAPDTAYQFTFSYPYANGGTWNLYATSDGAEFGLLLSGTYTTGAPAQRGSKSITTQ